MFYITKPMIKNINSYPIIYQTVILCLAAHPCVIYLNELGYSIVL